VKVINLNKARKARDKAKDRAKADGNAAAFGRSKSEKAAAMAIAEKARRSLDGHKKE
jgi:Domain of unknown function (DUF4169)